MQITGFIWLADIIDKIERKHAVKIQEVLQIFGDDPSYRFVEKGHLSEENVYSTLGQTDAGRYLIVYFVYKRDGRALVISCRDMTSGERKNYGRR